MAARGMAGLPMEDLTLDMILQLGLEGLGLEDAGLSFGDEDDEYDEEDGDSGGWETDNGEDEESEEEEVVKMLGGGGSATGGGGARQAGGASGGMQRRGAGQHASSDREERGGWWRGRGNETQDVGLGRGLQRARDLERMKGGGGVAGFLWRSWQRQPEMMCCGALLGVGATAMLVLGSKARWSLST